MVRGTAHLERGWTERSLGRLGLHTGEVTGGSSDSSPWMCSGLDLCDSHSFHPLNKTEAFKDCGWEVLSPLNYSGDEEIIFKTTHMKRPLKKNNTLDFRFLLLKGRDYFNAKAVITAYEEE